jgi:hypothetical protein
VIYAIGRPALYGNLLGDHGIHVGHMGES